jgi:hypothetical protein
VYPSGAGVALGSEHPSDEDERCVDYNVGRECEGRLLPAVKKC